MYAIRIDKTGRYEDIARACQNAIEWADRTMLVKLDEAIEKLLSSLRNSNFGDSYNIDKLVEDFHKAMEE